MPLPSKCDKLNNSNKWPWCRSKGTDLRDPSKPVPGQGSHCRGLRGSCSLLSKPSELGRKAPVPGFPSALARGQLWRRWPRPHPAPAPVPGRRLTWASLGRRERFAGAPAPVRFLQPPARTQLCRQLAEGGALAAGLHVSAVEGVLPLVSPSRELRGKERPPPAPGTGCPFWGPSHLPPRPREHQTGPPGCRGPPGH